MFEIEHLKSGLSISTHIGCPLNCEYCVLSMLPQCEKKPKRIAYPHDLVEAIFREETLFLHGYTPLLINNRTDPFLPEVINDTEKLLYELADLHIMSPVVIITKVIPTIELREIAKKINLIVLYSYSGLESDFNYLDWERLDDLKKALDDGAFFHYLRPIIPRRNDDLQYIMRVIEHFRDAGCSGTIISGLRLTQNNQYLLNNIEEMHIDRNHKVLEDNFYIGILNELCNRKIEYPIFRHTSCAIDYATERANRLNYYNIQNHCFKSLCPNYSNCMDAPYKDLTEIMNVVMKKLCRDIKYKISDGIVYVEDIMTQEEIAYIKNAYGIKINCKQIRMSKSEVYITSE